MLAAKSDALEERKEKSILVGVGYGRPWLDQGCPDPYKGFSLGWAVEGTCTLKSYFAESDTHYTNMTLPGMALYSRRRLAHQRQRTLCTIK